MDESIVVSNIIYKLFPSWKVVKSNLKHKKEDITLEKLVLSRRISSRIVSVKRD